MIDAARPHAGDRHVPGRQRARLVRADDGRRAERLDGTQPTDERLSTGHAAEPDRQCDRCDRGQSFGYRGDRQRDRRLEHQAHGAALRHAEQADERCDAQRQGRQTPSERIESPLERGWLLAHRAGQRADPADLGLVTRGCHHRRPDAGGHRGARIDHVEPVSQRRIAVRPVPLAVFGHRQRLARERGLVRPQVGLLDQPCVRGNGLAGGELDDVPAHDAFGVDRHDLPVAQHRRASGGEAEEGFHRPSSAELQRETEQGVHGDHDADCRGVEQVAHGERHDGRRHQQQRDHTFEL